MIALIALPNSVASHITQVSIGHILRLSLRCVLLRQANAALSVS